MKNNINLFNLRLNHLKNEFKKIKKNRLKSNHNAYNKKPFKNLEMCNAMTTKIM